MVKTDKPVKIYDVDRKPLGSGQLLSLSNGTIKVKGFNLPVLDSKTNIYIDIYNEFQGISPHFCEVSLASQNQLNANILRIEPTIERRKSLKVKTDLSFYIEHLYRLNEDITEKTPNMKINMLNLSIGGMLISSNYDLMIHDIIEFNFKYLNYQTINIKAKVIRIDKILDVRTKELAAVNYGCVFEKMNSYNESVITKCLFDRQLQLYKNW